MTKPLKEPERRKCACGKWFTTQNDYRKRCAKCNVSPKYSDLYYKGAKRKENQQLIDEIKEELKSTGRGLICV